MAAQNFILFLNAQNAPLFLRFRTRDSWIDNQLATYIYINSCLFNPLSPGKRSVDEESVFPNPGDYKKSANFGKQASFRQLL
jgi:hypothetical protein